MSRNEDRVAIPSPDFPISPHENNSNSGDIGDLNYVIPTEFIELPSKGKFYPIEHPLHNVSEVEIRHMTAKDEDILTSKSLLKKGIAVNRFLQGILIDQRIKIDDLLVGDKNAITLGARITGFGPQYTAQVVCPKCSKKSDFEFDLNKYHIRHGDETYLKDGYLHFDLPRTKVHVVCKLLDGGDEKALEFVAQKKRDNKLPDSPILDQLKQIIVSINGVNDRQKIDKFLLNLPTFDSHFLRGIYSKSIPNIELKQEFVCEDEECANVQEVEVPIGTNFFWPE